MSPIEVGYFTDSIRRDDLQRALEKHSQKTFHWQKIDFADFQKNDWIQNGDFLSGLSLVLLESEHSDWLIEKYPFLPEDLRETGYADFLVLQEGKLWPRQVFTSELKNLIVERAPALDTHQAAYIAASGAFLHMSLSLVARFGYKKIRIVTKDRTAALARAQKFEKLFFGVDLSVIDDHEITLQSNDGSLLISSLNSQEDSALLSDLTYLNFLAKTSLIIDLDYHKDSGVLIDEAKMVGLPHIAAREVGLRSIFKIGSYLGWFDQSLEQFLKDSTL